MESQYVGNARPFEAMIDGKLSLVSADPKMRFNCGFFQPRDIAGFRTFAASTAVVLNSGFLLSWEDVLAPLAPVTAVIF